MIAKNVNSYVIAMATPGIYIPKETCPDMSKRKSHVMASNDHLAKMDIFQLPLTKQSAFQKAGNNKALEVKKTKKTPPMTTTRLQRRRF